jgi:pyrroline-5-carboxylate reductase
MTARSDIVAGFVGAGRMAQALISGLKRSSIQLAANPVFFDPAESPSMKFQELEPASVRCQSLGELCRRCNLLVLAVKPQVMPDVLKSLGPCINSGHLVVSIAAGISISQLQSAMPLAAIVRVMPNTPCLVGKGISAISWSQGIQETARQLVRGIFQSVGRVVEVPESAMDAVTGLSGSGPAYVFTFVESLVEAGVINGIDPVTSRALVCATISGSMELLTESGRSPAELRQDVTSPGGTTLAGLEVLRNLGFNQAIIEAVSAATNRSRELGAR